MTLETAPAGEWAEVAEQRLLDAALPLVGEHGGTRRLIAAAARAEGQSAADAELLLPEGARDLAALLSRRHDASALTALSALDPATMKVRARIRAGVIARCEAAMRDREATRRWCGFLTLPTNAALGLRLAWESADKLWLWTGDTATDENHYTKRALLAEILISTLAIRFSVGEEAAWAHLDGRIGAVMAFEKWKAGVRPAATAEKAARILAKLRYGRRGAAA